MTVAKLIDMLEEMPEEFEVVFLVDDEKRGFDYMVNRGEECHIVVSEKEYGKDYLESYGNGG